MNKPLINKGFTGWGQLGILLLMVGLGLIVASVVSLGIWAAMTDSSPLAIQTEMSNPENADAVRVLQIVSTLLGFFLPAVAYAFICFRNGWTALGFQKGGVTLKLIGISLLLLLVCNPLIEALSQLNEAIPVPETMRQAMEAMESEYEKQVKLIADVSSPLKYLMSLALIALLPAVFEEILFRGAIQNLFERWFKNGWVAIVVTSVIFSAIHLSWYGFIPRIALGMVLGAIFFATRNIWYPIIAHFFNNAVVVTYMYYLKLTGQEVTLQDSPVFPWWSGIIAAVGVYFVYQWLHKEAKSEVPQEYFHHNSNPFDERNTLV